MNKSDLVLDTVYEFFCKSNDFNGIPLTSLAKKTNLDYLEVVSLIQNLVRAGKVSIQSDINPHIISLGHFDTDTQLKILEEAIQNKTEILDAVFDVEISSEVILYVHIHLRLTWRKTEMLVNSLLHHILKDLLWENLN